MKNYFSRLVVIAFAVSALFVQVAFAVTTETADPYTEDPTIVVDLVGVLNADGHVDLSWNEYLGDNLKYYKVVHSTTKTDAVYPTDGYIHYTTDAAATTYTAVPEMGSNHYRVCVLTNADTRSCSNTFTVTVDVEPELIAEGEAVTLTANQDADGTVDLTWTKYVGADFNGYKVVHSTSNPDLEYPADGYLKYITDSSSLSYVHAGPSAGMNYYRICTLVDSGKLCSNVVEIDSQFDLSTVDEVDAVVDPYTDDPEIVINLAVNMTEEGKASLLWTKYNGGDLRWYKVMHSTDNPLMYYPVDPHVAALSYAAETSYTHEPSAGLNYYRVCVITIDDKRGCSETEIVNSENSGDMPFVSLFSDMQDHWAKEYVNTLAADGVVSGIEGQFIPEREVNRAEALKMIMYAFDYTYGTCDATAFPDLKASDWFCDVASLAEKKGFISGDNGYLRPARGLTRAEAVKIVIEVKGDIMAMVNISPFADVDKDDWYARYAAHAKKLGIVSGIDGDFLPDRNISRAELAKIVSVAKELAEQGDL